MRIPGIRHGLWILLGVVGTLAASPAHDFGRPGPGGADFAATERTRAFGPLVEWGAPDEIPCLRAVRPFFTYAKDERGCETLDLLWPLGHIRRWQDETYWRFFTALYFGPRPTDPPSQYRFWILPLLAMGRNGEGENYGAVFPLGGRIENFFGRDRIEFALFPLYWHSELNDLRTDHWFWPMISRTTGNDLERFRVFPFYGYSEKKGVGESRFILWPFWTSARYDKPGNKGDGWLLFPIYGHSKTESGESWMVLPPFFRHSEGRSGTENTFLWPIYQTVNSKAMNKRYVWPLYGRRTTAQEDRRFWLWPFIWNRQNTYPGEKVSHVRVFPVFASESHQFMKKGASVASERYVSLWPLGSYERTRQDDTRLRIPDLWPFRDTAPIERNLSPIWTLYSHQRTARGYQSELLWGLARWGCATNGEAARSVFPLASWGHDTTNDKSRDVELLKGLFGYHRDEAGKHWRLLYFIKWKTRQAP